MAKMPPMTNYGGGTGPPMMPMSKGSTKKSRKSARKMTRKGGRGGRR